MSTIEELRGALYHIRSEDAAEVKPALIILFEALDELEKLRKTDKFPKASPAGYDALVMQLAEKDAEIAAMRAECEQVAGQALAAFRSDESELQSLRAENEQLKLSFQKEDAAVNEGFRMRDETICSLRAENSQLKEEKRFAESQWSDRDTTVDALRAENSRLKEAMRPRRFPEEKPEGERVHIWRDCEPIPYVWFGLGVNELRDGDLWLPLPPAPDTGTDDDDLSPEMQRLKELTPRVEQILATAPAKPEPSGEGE